MIPSKVLRARHTFPYKPMIHFLGKRSDIDHGPHAPAPHPQAPPEVAENFQSFLAKLQSSSGGSGSPSSTPKGQSTEQSAQGKTPSHTGAGGDKDTIKGPLEKKPEKPADYDNFWEAPSKLWEPRELTEREIDAIMSGGASELRSGP